MISIVGMACEYPDASSPKEFWNNIISKRISFREIPKERIDLSGYSDVSSPDSIYIKRAGLIEGYSFDREKYKISGSAYRSTDMVHWLALDVASRALDDAGFCGGFGLNKKNTGVIVGNTLTGEFSRSSLLRLRWPYVKKLLLDEIKNQENMEEFLLNLEKKFKQPFEPPGEDSLAGGLSNTIAGRICNYFDLKGGGFAVDGACSSSLLAIINACNFIESGAMDAVLVGGVDLSLDPFELVGFSRLGAMAKGDMRVYDKNPTGFIPGEGCGFVLLMNSEIAFSLGLRSYANIKGWGISSDGAGGITRPEVMGQKLALKRAYEKANYSIDTVNLFEGHGTGTSIGDLVELTALSEILSKKKHIPVIGSVKPNIGHTKAAAGIAGLIKAVMSLNTQLLPPLTGIVEPNEVLEKEKIKIIKDAELWPDSDLRAGVSSFGFGGINSHITIESTSNLRRKKITKKEKRQILTEQSSEIFLFSSDCYMELKKQIEDLLSQSISKCEMTDLSIDLINSNKNKKVRCSIVANSPEDFKNKLQTVLYEIDNRGEKTKLFLFDKSGVFLCEEKLRLGLLFPGQASPVRFNYGSLKFKKIEKLYKKYFKNFNNELSTSDAQSCIILSELAGLKLLSGLGVKAEIAVGHSLGELCAIYWAGALKEKELFELVSNRGNFMLNNSPDGAMIAIYAEESNELKELITRYDLEISAYNSTKQIIVSGSADGVKCLMDELDKKEIKNLLLPVKKPFHSKLMKEASFVWEKFLNKYSFEDCKNKIISTVTGEYVDKDNIKKNLVDQFTKPVLFKQAFEEFLKECDFCLEVGPGNVLGNLCGHTKVLSLDCCNYSIEKTLIGIASAYAIGGQDLNFNLLKNRYHKKYKHIKTFFSNQCETEKKEVVDVLEKEKKENNKNELIENKDKKPIDVFKEILSKKTELKINDIKDNQNLLKDLHMNSLNAGQAVAEFSKKIGVDVPISPMEFSNSTVGEIVSYLEGQSKKEFKKNREKNILGINNWIRIFELELKNCSLESQNYNNLKNESKWKLFQNNNELADLLFSQIEKQKTNGVLICLSNNPEDVANIELLVRASKYCLEQKVDKIVLLQHNGFAQSFIKSLNSELDAQLILVDTPYDKDFISEIVQESKSNKKILECVYDKNKKRFEKFLRILDLEDDENDPSDLREKTIVATGGGKGITFECVYALCKKYNNKLIILGRSQEENDEILKNNLLRLKNSNINFKYIKADISNKESITSAFKENLLDEAFCVIHGAGINNPCSIRDLNPEKIKETLNPKVLGIKNLLEILGGVRLVINFSSIIGITGMEGESHYAYANSWIDWISNNIRQNIRSISIDWSVWSGVGMGEKLGKIDELLNKEITPINPEQGVECFLKIVSSNLNKNVIVSGRIGSKPPLDLLPEFSLSLNRFTESIKIFYPNIEIVAETRLTLNEDVYLNDHCYKGEFVFPVAVGIEAIVQTAQALIGKNEIPHISELKLNRPIIIDNEGTILRIVALKEKEKIKIVLRSSQNNFQLDHFSCYVSFEKTQTQIERETYVGDGFYLDEYFYGQLFFQTGVFSCIESYLELEAYKCIGVLGLKSNKNYFSEYLPKNMIAGDPGIRDSAIHCLQACLPNKIVLPLKVESWTRFDAEDTEKYFVYGRQLWEKQDEYCFDLEVFNSKNEIVEIWRGLVLKELEEKKWDSLNLSLLNPYINRKSKKDLKILDFNIFITDKSDKNLMIKKCFGKEIKYEYRADGKPISEEGFISFSDCGVLNLIVGSESLKVSCDIEEVTNESRSWRSLLGRNYDLAEFIAKEANEDMLWTCTRVWSCLECVKKVGLVGEELVFEEQIGKSLIFSSFNFLIHSTIIEIKNIGLYCITILIEKK